MGEIIGLATGIIHDDSTRILSDGRALFLRPLMTHDMVNFTRVDEVQSSKEPMWNHVIISLGPALVSKPQ